MTTRRNRWAGFRLHSQEGEMIEIELNERGQLVDRPPRARRRQHPYCEDSDDNTHAHLRVARFLMIPESGGCSPSTAYRLESLETLEGSDSFEAADAVSCRQDEAGPGPYAGQWNESSFNDSCSFGWSEGDTFFDSAFGY
jgi:hypothetical protein